MDYFFIIFSLSMWLVGLFILWQIRYPEDRGECTTDAGKVSVIIPARDEEDRLPFLLQSLQKQTVQPGEVLVIDDGSSDNTAGTAESFNVPLIAAGKKPKGWVGKNWACWTGSKAAEYPILVFLDADVILEDDGLAKLLSTFTRENTPIAVQPYHTMKKPYEFLSAFFNIIVAAGLGSFTMAGRHIQSAGMFGPCLICSKENYFESGGHESVKETAVEDIALGKSFRNAGFQFSLFGGKGSVRFRMYPENFKSMVEGWTKSMAAGAGTTSLLPLLLSIFWISGGTVAFILILRLVLFSQPVQTRAFFLAVYLLYTGQTWWMLRRIGNFGLLTSLFFPVHLMFFHIVFFRSFLMTSLKKEIKWKGRNIRVEDK